MNTDAVEEAARRWHPADGPGVAGDSDTSQDEPSAHRVQWRWSYDRASIDRFIAEVDAERARLEAELEEAQNRLERARQGVPADAPLPPALEALLSAAHTELATLEREHDRVIARIRDLAAAEAVRILDEARRDAAHLRATAAWAAVQASAEHATDVGAAKGQADA